MFRRDVLAALGSLPFLGFLKPPREEMVIPKPARDRIAEVLAKGGKITSLTFYMPQDGYGSIVGGTMFFTKPEERDWQIRKG